MPDEPTTIEKPAFGTTTLDEIRTEFADLLGRQTEQRVFAMSWATRLSQAFDQQAVVIEQLREKLALYETIEAVEETEDDFLRGDTFNGGPMADLDRVDVSEPEPKRPPNYVPLYESRNGATTKW